MRTSTLGTSLGPDAEAPVFEDLSGVRVRLVKRTGKIAFFALSCWVVAVALTIVFSSEVQEKAKLAFQETVLQRPDTKTLGANRSDADLLIEAASRPAPEQGPTETRAASAGRPYCVAEETPAGAAFAAAAMPIHTRVYALLPNDVASAFLPLLRNCARVDVVMPEWFEIGGTDLAVTLNDMDAEALAAVKSIRRLREDRVEVWPVFSMGSNTAAADFLTGLGNERHRSRLVDEIIGAARDVGGKSACLRFRDIRPSDAATLQPFLTELQGRAKSEGLGLCLVAPLSDQLWSSKTAVSSFDKVIVMAYQEPWIGAHPQPLAPLDWFREQVKSIQNRIPSDKLVVAVGGHAVDWVAGSAIPERISLAEAMYRISDASAEVSFSRTARNSFSAFFDRSGNRHQIWMLDAASVYNNVKILRDLGVNELAVSSLGEEEPAYWDALAGELNAGPSLSFGVPSFPDNVVYRGQGAFYRFVSPSLAGQRLWRLDQDNHLIESVRFEVIPRPVQMERYGSGKPNQVALTFDDGPDPLATGQILDALKAHDAPATFFVVGTAVLSSADVLSRAMDEGHTVGSHSFSHPRMDEISPLMMRTELSTNQNLIEGVTGRSALTFRPPFVRGPGPLSEAEAMAFAVPEEEGYIVVGSDIVPTDWSGTGAREIVSQVLDGLEKNGGNVIVMHDGKSTGMHTAEAVGLLVPALRARGYEIVPLPTLLGMTPDLVMPSTGAMSSAFKGFSVAVIALWIKILTSIFWVCIVFSLLRSAIYLYLSARREPTYPLHFGGPPTVSVLVPAFNEERVIADAVRSILNSRYPNLTCVVIDDGSTDGTLKVMEEVFGDHPRVRVLTQANAGKWSALNLGFHSIDSEIAVCVDADTRIDPDAITEIVRPFADSKVAAVAGTVEVGNVSNLLTRFQSVEYTTAQQVGRRAQEHLNSILVVPGALGAWRVEAVRDVGLYSNETLTEDADLTIWLRRGGYRVAYAETAKSRTEAPADVRSLLKQRLRWSLGNLQTLWKHRAAFLELSPRRVLSMADMVFFGYVLPVLSPILDLLLIYFLTNLAIDWHAGRLSDGFETSQLAIVGVILVHGMDIATAWIAHRRAKAPTARLLYLVPLMNLFYRPLLYITVYRGLWAALSGRLARWNKLGRRGLGSKADMVVQ